ncbi:MAG TPA: hypothetical protein VGI91_09620 [Steroidobacteraceae bacterium]|jgi:hypothetical protein
MNTLRRSLLVGAALAGTGFASAAAEPAPYEPLAFLVGHCWRGTFPNSQVTDEHCFSWVYDGKFVRDQHRVHHGAGKADDLGESIYVWDAAARQLQYLYIESDGGFSRGTVSGDAQALVFPQTALAQDGQQQTYRSRWQRSGAEAYDVITEFLVKGEWQPGFSLHMQLLPAAG